MKNFSCGCGNTVYFENTQCVACEAVLGFLPDLGRMSALQPQGDGLWRAAHPAAEGRLYRQCANYSEHQVCNWMVPADEDEVFCTACRLNEVIPNLDKPGNKTLWLAVERRKRRLVFDLMRHGLPVESRRQAPASGLGFAFLEDNPGTLEFVASAYDRPVMTGHAQGLITINIREADDVERERIRVEMNEAQRTLLGHFRHEVGHYYWQRLVAGSDRVLERVRACFGDERQPYDQSLEAYYREGPRPGWQSRFISAYASAHPWEDWAECWAHYLQISDTLETAACNDMVRADVMSLDFEQRVDYWIDLARRINLLARSLDQADPYPFVLVNPVIEKLQLIERIIVDSRGQLISPDTATTSGTAD